MGLHGLLPSSSGADKIGKYMASVILNSALPRPENRNKMVALFFITTVTVALLAES
jgi:hypothetical protein